MQLTEFDALTFDCYGTLIDWETGIVGAIRPWLAREGVAAGSVEVLAAFAEAESKQQAETPKLPYPALLARVHGRLAGHFGITSSAEDARAFGASVGEWPAFADSAAALGYLERHYRLVVLSNVDNTSFAASRAKLGVAFDAVFTAEDIGSYKPASRNFEHMLKGLARRGIGRSRILHVAQSMFHDHVPATKIGLARCWIDRRAGRPGFGATMPPPAEVKTDFRFASLAEMVEAHAASLSG